jgi:predicted AAA+ superfamily ATPase
MVYIQRDLEERIGDNLDKPEIIAIIGPRQCGKSTLMRHVFEGLPEKDSGKAKFLNFEDRGTLELFVEDEKAFAEMHVKGTRFLFIDEFQYAKEGGRKLKFIYDTYPGTKIVISGSSAPGLTIHGIKFLVGRIFVFNLYPLSFAEFLRFKDPGLFNVYAGKKAAIRGSLYGKGRLLHISRPVLEGLLRVYKEYAIFGGYPRVAISEKDGYRNDVLKNIYSTYFLREIKDVLGLTTDFSLSKLIKSLSLQLGGLVSYSSLQEVSGFSYKDLLTHLNILEKTFICRLVPPFFTNKRKELVKVPKVYFFDNGLRNAVIEDFRPYENRQDMGKLNENFIFTQLAYAGQEPRFWRTKIQTEMDFVLEKEGKMFAIESKGISGKLTKSLNAFRENYKPYKTVVACPDRLEEKNGILYLPFPFISAIA